MIHHTKTNQAYTEEMKKEREKKLVNEEVPRLTQATLDLSVVYQNYSDGFLYFLANHRGLK